MKIDEARKELGIAGQKINTILTELGEKIGEAKVGIRVIEFESDKSAIVILSADIIQATPLGIPGQ